MDFRITSIKLYKRDEKEDVLEVIDPVDLLPLIEILLTKPNRRPFIRG